MKLLVQCSVGTRRAYFSVYINIGQRSWAAWRGSRRRLGAGAAIESSSPALPKPCERIAWGLPSRSACENILARCVQEIAG